MDSFEHMLEYIDNNGLEIYEPTYSEYPLNEVCVVDEKDYLRHV